MAFARDPASFFTVNISTEFEKDGVLVFPISAVSGQGLKELLYHVKDLLATCPKEITVFESEFDPTILEIIDEDLFSQL